MTGHLQAREAVVLDHGSGGRLTADLVEGLFLPAFRNAALETLDDQAIVSLHGGARLAFTTDSYVVSPIFFPGGDIGELAVNGTVNDLAVGGARPVALSVAFILEEGFPMRDLRRVVESIRRAAARANVPIVTGDTKVVGRGSGDGIFVNTSGVGVLPDGIAVGVEHVRVGDAIVISGTVGDHGAAILASRHGLRMDGKLESDTAPLHELCAALLEACPDVHAMRDPTRGGLAAALVEIASRRALGIEIDETRIPIRTEVRAACSLLAVDPLTIPSEGRLIAFVPSHSAARAVEALRRHALARDAVLIGTVTARRPGFVVLHGPGGDARVLEPPLHDPLCRSC
jgi:hydrogenase expression/formation protein HypE